MYDSGNNRSNAIAGSLTAGPLNNLGARLANGTPTLIGYLSGSTNCLFLTPAPGGTTINSLDSSGCCSGYSIVICNESMTDSLIFTHQGGGIPSNQFSNMRLSSVTIYPGGAATCIWLVSPFASFWQFA